MRTDYASNTVMPVYVSKGTEPVYKKFLIPVLMKYLQHADLSHKQVGFVAAIAFFEDGSVQYAYNKSSGQQYVVQGGVYAPDRYKNEGEACKFSSNAEFVREIVMKKKPEGLMLFQETPWREDKYRLRVIHNMPDDTVTAAKEEELSEKDAQRIALMNSCVEYLKQYSNEVEFTGIEQEEVIAILNLIGVLEQREEANRHDKRENRISPGASARIKMGKPAKILQFVRD